ncbi:Hypothetical protein D9617_37g012270 [Elsinoe fawcettii]|nr:Hypothetical protein D9617_37g012270 [Elsinoe fawcettii]
MAITELVQISLAVPFEKYWTTFKYNAEPILLAQKGLISVYTGPVYDERSGNAISLTQWESLDAHERFLHSEQAGQFFQAQEGLMSGPPTVSHYAISFTPRTGKAVLDTILHLYEVDPGSVEALGESSGMVGECIEQPARRLNICFEPTANDLEIKKGLRNGQVLPVQWYSMQCGQVSSSL